MSLPKLIVILGPTASGKTVLAVKLASRFNGEIVSADSRQIYRAMDIGTGKDLNDYKIKKLRITDYGLRITKIPHHLINLKNPYQPFTVAEYKKLAQKTIYNIIKRDKVPILVGGAGLYLSAVVDNFDLPKIKPDLKLRRQLAAMSLPEKLKRLKALDPAVFKFIDQKNPRRVNRALEVCLSGQKFSAVRTNSAPLFDALLIGLNPGKEKLAQKINNRVDKMIKLGLVEETKKLVKKYPPLQQAGGQYIAPLQTIGYAEIIDYLNDRKTRHGASLPDAINLIKLHTRQYAKRQLTWFKKMEAVNWIKNASEANKLVKKFLSTF